MDFSPKGQVNVPIIGQPLIIAAVTTALIICNCEAKTPLLAIAGGAGECPACHAKWALTAQMQLKVEKIVQLPEANRIES